MQPEIMYPMKVLAIIATGAWVLGVVLIIMSVVLWVLKAK